MREAIPAQWLHPGYRRGEKNKILICSHFLMHSHQRESCGIIVLKWSKF